MVPQLPRYSRRMAAWAQHGASPWQLRCWRTMHRAAAAAAAAWHLDTLPLHTPSTLHTPAIDHPSRWPTALALEGPAFAPDGPAPAAGLSQHWQQHRQSLLPPPYTPGHGFAAGQPLLLPLSAACRGAHTTAQGQAAGGLSAAAAAAAAATAAATAATAAAAAATAAAAVHSSQLQQLVQQPTAESWSRASELIRHQVPARVNDLQRRIAGVVQRMQGQQQQPQQRSQQQPQQQQSQQRSQQQQQQQYGLVPASEAGHIHALVTAVSASCDRVQRACDAFIKHCVNREHQAQPQGSGTASPCGASSTGSGSGPATLVVDAAGAVAAAQPAAALQAAALQGAAGAVAVQQGGAAQGSGVAQAADCFLREVDAESERVTSDLRRLTERPGWWDQQDVVTALDEIMDMHMGFTLAMRVLLAETLCCWARLRRTQGLTGMGFSEDEAAGGREAARWSMAGPRGPPGWEEAQAKRLPPSLIAPDAPLVQLLRLATEDTRAFCVEKNSTAPEVVVQGDEQLRVTCIDSYVQHVYQEVLKNSMQALIDRFGAWDVDEAEPVLVTVELVPGPITSIASQKTKAAGAEPPPGATGHRPAKPTGGTQPLAKATGSEPQPDIQTPATSQPQQHLRLTILDQGGGLSPEQLERCSHWFSTTHASRRVGYGYSRDHGAQFQGLGVGMPLSRVYARLMGGSFDFTTDREEGRTEVRLRIPCDGFSF